MGWVAGLGASIALADRMAGRNPFGTSVAAAYFGQGMGSPARGGMMVTSRTSGENPIVARVAKLRAQWMDFSQDETLRLLHWVIEPDEWKTLEAFFALEDEVNETEDLFLQPDVAFEHPDAYALEVMQWLAAEYEKIREDLEAAGLDASWTVPLREPDQTSVEALVATLASFHEHHRPLYRNVALVLAPTYVADGQSFVRWLEQLVDAMSITNVRIVAFDYRESLVLAQCAHSRARHTLTVIAGLDMPAAYEEISQAAGIDKPAGQFRHTYLRMLNAMESDLPRARTLGEDAAKIAATEGWLHLVFCVHYSLASGSLGAKDYVTAIRDYRKADEIAYELHRQGVDFGRGLQLRAQMAAGTACFLAEVYDRAARMFEEAAPLAEEVEEQLFVLECWRMASLCHERRGDIDRAWECGMLALAAGEAMKEADRLASTLPFVGGQLLGLTKHRRYHAYASTIDAQMRQLIDEDWRDRMQPGEPDLESPHPMFDAQAAAQ